MPTAENPKLFAERYLPVRKLGKGGMGEVWLVQDTFKGNMPVALKFVCTELANDTRAINDLSREVVNAQKLTHSNILRIYELMKYKNTFFIAMEYVAGEDLNARLGLYQQEGHNFSLEEVLVCARQICPALDYAHDQKVLHLDIKPSNIICDERDNYKLMDFGIARSAHDSMTRVTRAHGYTGGYASPEQVTGQTLTRRTDIYCLAATFYDLLAGKVPCPSDYATVNTVPAPIQGIPQVLNDAILAGLKKDPEERPAKAGDLLNLLLGKGETVFYPEHPPQPTPPRPAEPKPAKPRRKGHPVAWTVIIVGAMMIAGGIIWGIMEGNKIKPTKVAKVETPPTEPPKPEIPPAPPQPVVHKVPNLMGMDEAKAKETIISQGWQVGKVEKISSDEPKGTIVNQMPTAYTELSSGSLVSLQVSKGIVSPVPTPPVVKPKPQPTKPPPAEPKPAKTESKGPMFTVTGSSID